MTLIFRFCIIFGYKKVEISYVVSFFIKIRPIFRFFRMKIRINLVFFLFLLGLSSAAKRGLAGKHGNRGLAC